MSVEFIGILGHREGSESRAPQGPVIDPAYLGTIARAHEYAGFDRALVGYHSSQPDGFQVVAYAAQQTERLQFLLAHRPGFLPATIAARNLATLDHFSNGRLAVHIITGGDDADQQRDGDFLTHDERYERTDEFLDVVTRFWSSPTPFDHDGKHYKVKNSLAAVKPLQKPRVPIYFGGASEAAIQVGAKHADVYALWGETLAQVRETVDKVRTAAAKYGRAEQIRFSLSLRPVLGATEAEAWARADRIFEAAKTQGGSAGVVPSGRVGGGSVGSQRLREAAALGRVVDKRLWTALATLPNARGSVTGLVGTGEQVAESLLDYYDAGISTFLIRGFDPIEDALGYGRELLPRVRAAVAQRERSSVASVSDTRPELALAS
jgi:alkanesulfonate monooxygenase